MVHYVNGHITGPVRLEVSRWVHYVSGYIMGLVGLDVFVGLDVLRWLQYVKVVYFIEQSLECQSILFYFE